MSLLSVSEISFEYPSRPSLLRDVSFSINEGDRIGVVGANGAGKSTLLRLLSGEFQPSSGHIIRRRGIRIAATGQDVSLGTRRTLFDSVFEALPRLAAVRTQIQQSQNDLSEPDDATAYAALISDYEASGGFDAEADVRRILSGLGYSATDLDRDVQSLSGGERARVELARALSADADLYILDEPTNHLDINAREWLAGALGSRGAAIVLTSHDRTLLSRFADRIVKIDDSTVRVFEGDYAGYRRARALLDRQARDTYEAYQRRQAAAEQAAKQREEVAARVSSTPAGVRHGKDHYARKAAKVARTARMLRERATESNAVKKPWEEQPIPKLTFERMQRSGDTVLVLSNIAKGFGAKTLFRDISLHLRRGDRLAIIGANGSGKTTLLNIVQGTIPPDSGSVRLGANVHPAFVGQNEGGMDLDRTPLGICGSDAAARTLLGCLKLSANCLNTPLRDLSGGERTKVALVRILNSGANLLVLDEPTNHLEIEAQEALEQALKGYPGTVIVVSHDRSFLDGLGPELSILNLSRTGTSG